MFRKRVTLVIAVVTVCSLLMGTVCFAADDVSKENTSSVGTSLLTEEKGSAEYTSAENIYATLASDGSFENAYVINSFDVKKAGTITSYGEYDFLKNLTTLDVIQSKNGVQTFTAEKGKFYYQGNTSGIKLPWKISITYLLGGKEVTAEELAGKSGALEIVVKIGQESSVNPEFYENYMLQATFTLDMEKCSNIKAEGAAVAEAGSNKTVIFTGLPGQDTEMILTADVEEFEMDAISIAAVPFSMAFELPDTDEMADGLTQLADAIQQLDEGVAELETGMDTLADNAGTLKEGSGSFAEGISTVSANSETLVNASAKIQGALQIIAGNLGNVDMSSMEGLAQLPNTLDELASMLENVETGLKNVPAMYSKAYGDVNAAVGNISSKVLSESELKTLKEAAQNGNSDAEAAYQKVESLNTLAGQLAQAQSEVKQVDGVVEELAENVGQLAVGIRLKANDIKEQMAGQDIAGAMSGLQSGMKELAGSYSEFHTGLAAYTDGVDILASSYGKLNQGLNAYLNGVELAADGAGELKDGTGQLAVSTENIPEEMQKQIDEFMEDYQFDFTPVSFMDERNDTVTSVQFIISTPKIAMPEPEKTEQAEEEKTGIIERMKGLFE